MPKNQKNPTLWSTTVLNSHVEINFFEYSRWSVNYTLFSKQKCVLNGPPTVQSSAVVQVRGKLKLLSKKKLTLSMIKWFEKIVNF